MPSPQVDRWHESRLPVRLAGRRLHTVPHPVGHGPLSSARLQGEAFYLEDDEGGRWILKKFNPRHRPSEAYIRSVSRCLPLHRGFQSGLERTVISSGDLVDEPGCHATEALSAWLEDTVLMPRIHGTSCAEILEELQAGLLLPLEERAALALDLVEQVGVLEGARAAHRDLSGGNVLLDLDARRAHLIDWDTLYHGSLPFQPNTSLGSPGYLAPWLDARPETSWRERADRYALAVMAASLVAGGPALRLWGDGQFLDQDQEGPPTPASVETLRQELGSRAPSLLPLLDGALVAPGFDECPSPADWARCLERLVPGRGVALDALGDQEVATFGEWSIVRQGPRLWLGHRDRDVSLELNLRGLGAFAVRDARGERTVFSDGKRSALCRFRVRGRDALARGPSRPLRADQDTVLENYRFVCRGETLAAVHQVAETRLVLEAGSATCRYEWEERSQVLGEAGRP